MVSDRYYDEAKLMNEILESKLSKKKEKNSGEKKRDL